MVFNSLLLSNKHLTDCMYIIVLFSEKIFSRDEILGI